VYLEAAKGSHEAAAQESARILGWFLFFLAGAVIQLGLVILGRLKPNEPGLSSRNGQWALRSGVIALILAMLFILGNFTVLDLEVSASNQAYTYFRQSLDICRPYISEHDSQVFESRFAAIRTRDEYVGITDDLKRIAAPNRLSLPDFKPW
jgi:hypothetical protein